LKKALPGDLGGAFGFSSDIFAIAKTIMYSTVQYNINHVRIEVPL
jgi:hypothetical protein